MQTITIIFEILETSNRLDSKTYLLFIKICHLLKK